VILCFSVLKTAHIIVVQYNVLCILTDLVHVCTVDAKYNFDNSRSKNSRVILSWASRRRDDSGTELFLNSCARGLTSQRWTISITTLVILCFSVLKTAHIIVVQYNVLCILTDLVHVCTVDAKYNMYMYNNNDYIHVFIERYNFRIPHSHYTHSSTILS